MKDEAHRVMKWVKGRLKTPDELTEREVYLLKKFHPSWHRYVVQYRILNEIEENPEELFEQRSALERHKKRCPYCQRIVETDRDEGQASTAVSAHVFNKADPLHGGKHAYPDDWNKKQTETDVESNDERVSGNLLDY